MASNQNLSVVIDVGTSKLVGLAGKKNELGKIEIVAIAKTASKGIKRGIVFNIDEVASSVNRLLNQLEAQLDTDIETVDIAYAGQYMKTINFQGYRFTSDDGIVSRFDMNELYNEAKNFKVEQDYKTIHVIPQSFVIDDETIELNPVGITGRKIEANYKLITVPEIQITNFRRVFDKINVELGKVNLSTLAISEAVLTNDEKEIGAIVLDIGAGTTKLTVFSENRMLHTAVIPFGGNVITKDIKEGCSILIKWAEQLKIRYGEALGDQADDQKVVTIPGHNGWDPKEISFRSLAFIIQARIEEILDSVNYQIEKSNIDGQVGSGIVVTGGTSQLNNLIPLVKFHIGMDSRIAFPVIHTANKKQEVQKPEYFTALGLLKMALKSTIAPEPPKRNKEKKKKETGGGFLNKFVQGVLDLVDDDNEDIAMN